MNADMLFKIAGFIALAILGVVAAGVLWMLDIPLVSMDGGRAEAAKSAVEAQIQRYFPASSSRIERKKNNLFVYMEKSDFQSIPFPDQSKFVVAVAGNWCRASHTWGTFARLEMRDIRTGENFGKKYCVGIEAKRTSTANLNPIEVEGPDGIIHEFPAGTPVDVMKREMKKLYPSTPRPPAPY